MASSSMSMVSSDSGSGNDNGNGNGNGSQLSEKEKGSRNKRKFRADPPPPLPLVPCTECNAHVNGNANKGFIALSGWKMGYHSVESFNGNEADVDGNGNPSAAHNHNHNHNQIHNHNHNHNHNYNHNHSHNHNHNHNPACYATNGFCNSCKAHQEHLNSCKCSALLIGAKGIQSDNRETGFRYEEFSSGERLQEDRELDELQEADWSDNTESQLEELLLSNLDTIYKSAIKKIVASGYTEGMALRAILKHSKCCCTKDTLSHIVDNALAYLSNTHDVDGKDLYFEDLQQLEKYILADMVCVLRRFRPFFSSGDAMWCLLICDMNVGHACAMDDDALSNFSKDSIPTNTPVATSVQSNPETSSSSVPPAVSTNMPAFNKNATLSHSVPQNPQVANSSMPFVTGMPNFPIQGFSMSGNMIQNTCKHDCISASNISEDLQCGPVHPCFRMGDSKLSCNLQIGAVLPSDDFQGSPAFTAALGTEYKPGYHASEVTAEDCALSMAQPFQKAEKFIYEGNKMKGNLNINPAHQKGNPGTLVSLSGPANKVDQAETSEVLLKMSSIEKVSCLTGIENSDTTCRTISSSCIKCPGGNEVQKSFQNASDSVQKDLLIGKPKKSVEPELSMRVSRMDPDTVDDASSFAVAGAELSLSLASSRDREVIDSLSVAEDVSDSNYDTISLDQIFGGNGSQDRKDEMIMKMFHRAREIETQLQEWTEWAQQKVMQAARRLSKEKAELKSLRQEKEEVARLKKEKQSLEESTTKKLSEMQNALQKANAQVEHGNAAVLRLKEENLQLRHEMEAAKLKATKSAAACQEVSKREKKTVKKFQVWERQKAILQEELTSEKHKLVHLQQQLVKAKERQLQIEVRWRQEEKAKEEAIMRATTEKQAKEQIEATTKRKEDALHQKAEMDSQRYRDDVQRLEHEIAQLRFTTESSKLAAMQWGSNSTVSSCLSDTNSIQVLKQTNARLLFEIAELQDLSQSEVQRDRECVMCLSEERSVVFLPCAHQVVCTKCNELHGKQGMNDCPSCRTLIQQRVCVYSANS